MGGLLSPTTEATSRAVAHTAHKAPAAAPPALSRIPPELLVEIFTVCNAIDALSALRLSQVTHFWRDLILGFPRIWQHIPLDERTRPLRTLRTQTDIWIARSAPLLFDVEIHLQEADSVLSLLSSCLQNVDRWRSCRIIRNGSYVDFVKQGPIHGLERLELSVCDAEELMWEPEVPPPTRAFPSFLPSTTQSLLSMLVYVSILPDPLMLTPMRFTALDLSEFSPSCTIPPRRLLGFLSALPELEELSFAGWPQEPTADEDPTSFPVPHLPHLQSLAIRNTCSTRPILSHLNCPNLVELTLEHLNVEFKFQHVNDFTEDGDADPAPDFSQSPCSDHATGMGLRNLIRRCDPPLEVLEMDYADMRTADFEWCFDRLPTLRVFRIVASDMSDSVIRLLAPCRPAYIPPDVDMDMAEDEMSMDDPEQGLRLRAPLLSVLDLAGCQRLTGDALVDALRSRDDFALACGEEGLLEEVRVFNCHRFSQEHAQMLEDALGTRFIRYHDLG